MASSCHIIIVFFSFTVFVAVQQAAAVEQAAPDPCKDGNHEELDERKRSTGYVTKLPEKPACDVGLTEGWYRFTSLAGGQMPTTCQRKNKCGTTVPLWMEGKHPTVVEGEVTRQVCGDFYSSGNSCCDEKFDIRVKNCGQFFVYFLKPTQSCPVAYCAGTLSPCPVGKWSPTGFPPCKFAYPELENPPTLQGPNLLGKSFDFQCEIIYNQNDPDQRFEVVWTFDGKTDINVPPEVLSDPSRIARLDGAKLRGHINSNIQCQVRSFYIQNTNEKSDYLHSKSYYAGIHIYPATLVVSEQMFSKTITVNSTVPVICSDGRASCCLTFKLDIDTQQASVANKCFYMMCTEDWDMTTKSVSVEVPVIANQDRMTDGDKEIFLTFEKLLPAAGGPYLDVFAQHMVDQVPVFVQDQDTSSCSITGDPHIKGFDYETYHLYKTGDFTAYEIPTRQFEIQIRTWPCRRSVTCNCAVVIREKNDVIRIDMCDQVHENGRASPLVSTAREVRESTVIQRSQEGRKIAVYLPSGVEVKVDVIKEYMNVYITGPGTDKGKARGICGTNDGKRDNEFTHPDGTIDRICSSRNKNCQPNRFFEAWRVPRLKSLFEIVPDIVDDTDEVTYCGCNNKDKVVNCSPKENIKTGKLCTNCVDVKAPVIENAPNRRKREVAYEDTDMSDAPDDMTDVETNTSVIEIDSDKQWPNDQGLTEAEARELCSTAMKKSQLNSACGEMNDIEQTSMIDCLSDILYSGTTDFLDSITSTFTSECQLTMAKDPANYVTDERGEQVMKAEYLDDICDMACDEHGSCGPNGTCICDDGWEGVNCHMLSGKGPQLERIRSGHLCDTAQRPCKRIFIDVSNINLSDKLTCRVQQLDENGVVSDKPNDTLAIFISAFRIACDLPEMGMDVHNQLFVISASNDGSLFSNEMKIQVFDSDCVDCNEDGCTEKTSSTCARNSSTHSVQLIILVLIFLALLSLMYWLA